MREDKEIEWEATDQWMSADGSGGDEIDSIPDTSSYYVYLWYSSLSNLQEDASRSSLGIGLISCLNETKDIFQNEKRNVTVFWEINREIPSIFKLL